MSVLRVTVKCCDTVHGIYNIMVTLASRIGYTGIKLAFTGAPRISLRVQQVVRILRFPLHLCNTTCNENIKQNLMAQASSKRLIDEWLSD